jgi:Asp-tRNA(Asn)/Glu-tRNA(Gln) amidotransferase A subunit family amidase
MSFPVQPTIAEIAKLLRAKQISPVELVEAHLRRADSLQLSLNSFVHIDSASALQQAEASEAAILTAAPLGPLHGVPLSIKSCIDVSGWPCPAGSLLRKDYIPLQDAPLVARLKSAGAILIGNTNTPENLMAYETGNLVSGRTSNPWSLSHSSGGSSGGEAAAIASGCSVAGVGSDGGGSIRVPAHFCGVCGLKPTPGRVPSTGHFPPGAGALSWLGVVGPMARTVADLRTLFEVMSGPDPGDALCAPVAHTKPQTKTFRGLHIGILESESLGEVTPETRAAVQSAATLLANSGFTVEPFQLRGLDRALELWWFFFGSVIAHIFHQSLGAHEKSLSPGFRDYLSVALRQSLIPLDEFMSACTQRDLLRADLLRQTQNVTILLSPVSSGPAFRHGEGTWRSPSGYRETMRHSQWLNLAGFPGLSLPMGKSLDNLPIGIQLIARPHEEELLLAVAETLEQARGPWQPPPLPIS